MYLYFDDIMIMNLYTRAKIYGFRVIVFSLVAYELYYYYDHCKPRIYFVVRIFFHFTRPKKLLLRIEHF